MAEETSHYLHSLLTSIYSLLTSGHFFFSLDAMCRTIASSAGESPYPNKKCIFPFTYNDREFINCIKNDSNGAFWCATEVDSDGNFENTSDKWGICSEECPKEGKLYNVAVVTDKHV